MKWIHPSIDKNSDAKIDSYEYQAIQVYKKKHSLDWQGRARRELRLTAPKEPVMELSDLTEKPGSIALFEIPMVV